MKLEIVLDAEEPAAKIVQQLVDRARRTTFRGYSVSPLRLAQPSFGCYLTLKLLLSDLGEEDKGLTLKDVDEAITQIKREGKDPLYCGPEELRQRDETQ